MSCHEGAIMSTARIVAKLVEAGHEDLAEELLSHSEVATASFTKDEEAQIQSSIKYHKNKAKSIFDKDTTALERAWKNWDVKALQKMNALDDSKVRVLQKQMALDDPDSDVMEMIGGWLSQALEQMKEEARDHLEDAKHISQLWKSGNSRELRQMKII
jgi:homoserine acetyltransferase